VTLWFIIKSREDAVDSFNVHVGPTILQIYLLHFLFTVHLYDIRITILGDILEYNLQYFIN
jgi:hypothetical protein